MNALDYILDAVLVATIFLQLRGRRLTPRNLLLPIAIVAYFMVAYLKGVPTAGGDPYLIGGGIALGAVLGLGAGFFTQVRRGEGGVYAKAGPLAATFWTIGVVLRTAFSVYATDGGASADRHIGRLMHAWNISSSNAIVACLLLMVLVEVIARQLLIGSRYLSLRRETRTVSTRSFS
jgi:hypothetical protein